MNLDVFLRLATPDSSDKNPIPFGGTSVGGSRAARSELHGPSVATLPRYSALRLFTHTQLCRALLRERHDDASASASASANTTSSRSVGRDWCCRRGTEMQHCRSSRRSAMRSTMRSTCHVTSAFHCQPVSRRTGRGRRPPSLSSYSVVRARLLSPISSKSAAGTMLRPNEKVFSAYTEANTGSVLSRAIPSGGEERERERERGLTRSRAHSGRRLMPIIRRKSHHHHQTIGSCSRSHPRSRQCNGGARPPIAQFVLRLSPSPHLPSSRSETNPRRFQSPREANWFAKEGRGGRVPTPSGDREREGAAKSAVHHHHHPPPPTITCERHLFVLAPPALVAAVFP